MANRRKATQIFAMMFLIVRKNYFYIIGVPCRTILIFCVNTTALKTKSLKKCFYEMEKFVFSEFETFP